MTTKKNILYFVIMDIIIIVMRKFPGIQFQRIPSEISPARPRIYWKYFNFYKYYIIIIRFNI